MSYLAVSDTFMAVCKENIVDCYDFTNHSILDVTDKDIKDNISDITISSDNLFLALITTETKRLLIYTLPQIKLAKSFVLPRSASKINFSFDNRHIFVADKTGDVLSYDIVNEGDGIKLLGHLSLLLNIIHTNNGHYIITSDRDEKIKVSQYPNTYNIQTFCLGHTEYVNHLELLPHNEKYVVSASGDGTVKCWNYLTGSLCLTLDTNLDIENEQLREDFIKCMDQEGIEVKSLPILHTSLSYMNECSSLIAVSVYSYKKILVYSINTANEEFTCKLEAQLSLENFPAAIKFNKSLLYVYDDVSLKVLKYGIAINGNNKDLQEIDRISLFESQNKKFIENNDINSIKVLFKRKFDNVQEYQERKKQRLAKPVISTA